MAEKKPHPTENPMLHTAHLIDRYVTSTYEDIDGHYCDVTMTLADLLNAYGLDAVTTLPDGSCTFELSA